VKRRETVREVLERLGTVLLRLEAGTARQDRIVEDVVIYDSLESASPVAGCVVLGVGVHDLPARAELLRTLGSAGACALVVRAPVVVDETVRAATEEHGIALLSLVEGASWINLARLVVPPAGTVAGDNWATPGDLTADLDLFKVANSLSALLHAPVTIEDLSSHILAFSADQGRADEPRKASVLGQRVPEHYNAQMTSLGLYRLLYTSERPVFVEPFTEGIRGRAAIRVRADDELLGSIWAVVDQPLEPSQEQAMIEAADIVAIAMLRIRIATDAVHHMRAAIVTALIGGGQPARQAAAKLRGGPVVGGCVIAAGMRYREAVVSDASVIAGLERLSSSFMMLLRAALTDAITSVVDDTIYAVVPEYPDAPLDLNYLRKLCADFVQGPGGEWRDLVIGIGEPVSNIADLARSRNDADLVLRVLRTPSTARGLTSAVVTRDDVHGRSLLLRLADIVADDGAPVSGPIVKLREYDRRHQSALEETLRCWLDNFGDIALASRHLHIHKNTLRYRLARISEIAAVDLDNTEERFQLMIQLWVNG
jgi:hypothetical protein